MICARAGSYQIRAILHATVRYYARPNRPKLGNLALFVLVREPSRPRRAPLGFWRVEIKNYYAAAQACYLKAEY